MLLFYVDASGVKILFEGLYRTDWTDDERGIRWMGLRSFYQECVDVIVGRIISKRYLTSTQQRNSYSLV